MQRIQVSSTDLKSVGYDEDTLILEIEFHSGGIYQYSNVPLNIYNGLMNASSKGTYCHQNIKKKYRYRKIN